MKRIFVLLIAIIGTMSLSAAGNPEAKGDFGPRGPRFNPGDEEWVQPELVELSGTVIIEDDFIILKTADKEYLVRVHLTDKIAIKNGDKAEVSGYIMPRPVPRLDGIIRPVTATVNNTVYVFTGPGRGNRDDEFCGHREDGFGPGPGNRPGRNK